MLDRPGSLHGISNSLELVARVIARYQEQYLQSPKDAELDHPASPDQLAKSMHVPAPAQC